MGMHAPAAVLLTGTLLLTLLSATATALPRKGEVVYRCLPRPNCDRPVCDRYAPRRRDCCLRWLCRLVGPGLRPK